MAEIIVASIVALLFSCSSPASAGGSSDSGNIKFADIIYSSTGEPTAGAMITLCSEYYTNDTEADMAQFPLLYAVTDKSGQFEFPSVKHGRYCTGLSPEWIRLCFMNQQSAHFLIKIDTNS